MFYNSMGMCGNFTLITTGGLCIYLDLKVPCRLLESCNQDEVESIWISTRSNTLPRQITSIVLDAICHSMSNREPKNVILRQHIQRNLDMLSSDQPNTLVIITGDFNHHTTGFKLKDIFQGNHLKQLVTFKTRDSDTLDWLFTNRPKLLSVSQLPKVASSDYYTILARPMISSEHKPVLKKIESRDMREWSVLGRSMTEKDWYSVLNAESCEDKFRLFMMELTSAMDSFLPRKIVKKHPTDRLWISEKPKSLIHKRQSAFLRHGKDSANYKFWRNKVQYEVKKAKNHYYHDKVAQVASTNPSKWWRQIKSLTSQDIQQEWYHQFLGDTINTNLPAHEINDFFVSLTDHISDLRG